jgi:hypothetical protein
MMLVELRFWQEINFELWVLVLENVHGPVPLLTSPHFRESISSRIERHLLAKVGLHGNQYGLAHCYSQPVPRRGSFGYANVT